MTKDNECYAYFTLAGEFDPKEITERLGIEPTDSWKKGDTNEKTRLERKFSRWSLYSQLPRTASFEDQINDVLTQLDPIGEKVREAKRSGEAYIQLVGFFYADFPGFGLDAAIISKLAALELGFDSDFYYLYSDKREDA
jgi:hypothetical protein